MRPRPPNAASFLVVTTLWALASAAAGAGEPPRLGLPVDCAAGSPCLVQHYVDMAAGPEARDHTCGALTYDGHNGIDIRLPTKVEMRAGVTVRAAAPGTVVLARDGTPDSGVAGPQDWTEGRADFGNSVMLDHGGGWVTQYSHLRRRSLAVAVGQRVAAGAPLGQVGLSGRTEFPHLHFLVLREGRSIDPFSGRPAGSGCGGPAAGLWTAGLWTAAAKARLAYRPGGALAAGFAGEAPTRMAAMEGAYRGYRPGADAPLLVFWAAAWGLRAEDRENIRLTGPDGAVLAEAAGRLSEPNDEWFRFVGAKRPGGGWPAGTYRGEYRVERQSGGQWLTVVETAGTAAVF